ncbi:MAG: hypothetical protein ABIQ95_02140 [Bdellovibrionia bacterium]
MLATLDTAVVTAGPVVVMVPPALATLGTAMVTEGPVQGTVGIK